MAGDSDGVLSFAKGDGLTGYFRGWYINKINHSQDFKFSPFFGFTLWVRPYSFGVLVDKALNLDSYLRVSLLSNVLSLQFIGASGIFSKQFSFPFTFTWLLIGLSFDLSTDATSIKLFLNSNQVTSSQLQSDYLINPKESHIYLGDSTNKM